MTSGRKVAKSTNEEQGTLDGDSFEKIDHPSSTQPPETKSTRLKNRKLSKSVGDPIEETCREELSKPESLDFNDRHFELKPNVGLKVNTKRKRKELGGSFEKIDVQENIVTDSPDDNLGFSFFPVKSKAEETVLSGEVRSNADSFAQRTKIDDLPPSSIILHYHRKDIKEPAASKQRKVAAEANGRVETVKQEGKVFTGTPTSLYEEVFIEDVVLESWQPKLEFQRGSVTEPETPTSPADIRLAKIINSITNAPIGDTSETNSKIAATDNTSKPIAANTSEQSSENLPQPTNPEDASAGESNSATSPLKMDANPPETRVLTLNANEHQETVLYRVEQGWIVQFRLGPSLLGRKVMLFCNYPQVGRGFRRNEYYELQWLQDEGCSHADDTALYAEFVAGMPGSFHYYFAYSRG